MSWNDVGSESNGNKVAFLKLPQGLTNIRILDAEPVSRWQHWVPQANRSITCPGKGCPICELNRIAKKNGEDKPYSQRKTHSLNVINRTTGELEVLEQGNNFFEDLRILRGEYGDVRDYDIKIRRTGLKTNTKYRIDAEDATPLTDDEKAIERHDLKEYFAAPTVDQVTRLVNGEDPQEVFKSEDVELA